jgi:hypothetical protein
MINGTVNSVLKIAFHNPRPYWFSRSVDVYGNAENSFGVPSGHSQNAIIVWGTIAQRIKTRWAWIVASIIILMIGISRLYLGMHDLQDVLAGWIFGIVMLWLFLHFEKPIANWMKRHSPGMQVLFSFLFSLGLILVITLVRATLSGWSIPTEWISNARQAFPEEPVITPLSFHNVLSAPAAMFGLAAGWIWITSLGGFSVQGVWWKLILRYFAGLVGVLILYMGLGSIFPETETISAYILRYIRYALIGFWMAGFAPWLFVKIKLADRLQ